MYRLMKNMGLRAKIRGKKYRSFKGTVGKIADNVLDRDWKA